MNEKLNLSIQLGKYSSKKCLEIMYTNALIAYLSKSFVHLYCIDSHPNNTSQCKVMKKKGHYVTSYFVLCPSDSNNVEKVNHNQTDANISQGCCGWLLSNFTAKLCKVELVLSGSWTELTLSLLGYYLTFLSRFLLSKLIYLHSVVNGPTSTGLNPKQ